MKTFNKIVYTVLILISIGVFIYVGCLLYWAHSETEKHRTPVDITQYYEGLVMEITEKDHNVRSVTVSYLNSTPTGIDVDIGVRSADEYREGSDKVRVIQDIISSDIEKMSDIYYNDVQMGENRIELNMVDIFFISESGKRENSIVYRYEKSTGKWTAESYME